MNTAFESITTKRMVLSLSAILVLGGLYATRAHSYLLFHSLAEFFSVAVACGIFMVAWNSRQFFDNTCLMFLGIAYLFIGGLDMLHTLAYKGMGVFKGYDADLPTQLWIGARYVESISLLLAPWLLTRKMRINLVFFAYSVALTIMLMAIFYWKIFPHCFVEGLGLTPFKKISEYLISAILVGSVVVLFQKREKFDGRVFWMLVASIVLTIGAELAFTFYVSVYGLSNLVGHFFKIISFYLIYRAIIHTGLRSPYRVLFRNLKKSEEQLKESEKKYRDLVDNSLVGVYKTNLKGDILYMNGSLAEILQFESPEAVMSEGVIDRYKNPKDRETLIERLRESGKVEDFEVEIVTRSGETITVILAAVLEGDFISGMMMDISQRKRAADELRLANQKILEQQRAVIEEERLKVLLQMAGATAHELNQPLMVLLGNIDLLTTVRDDPGKLAQYVAGIEKAGERMSGIVKKIQNIRHYEIKPYPGHSSIINLDQRVRMLSVEDSDGDFETIKQILGEHNQIELSRARDIQEAFGMLEHDKSDLILIDHTLPDGNGLEFLSRIKNHKYEIPVIVITEQGDEMTASQVIQAGACDYLSKDTVSVESLLSSISNALEMCRLKKEIRIAQEKMREMSTRDALTGLCNRRYFMEALEREVAIVSRNESSLLVCMVNLDHFKQVNDTYGSDAGDMVLREIGKLLTECFRTSDLVCRYDGKEFAVMLPNTRSDEAWILSERIRQMLAANQFKCVENEFRVTVSIGIASYDSDMESSSEELLKVANYAVSEAKEAGRNRVVLYQQRESGGKPKLGNIMVSEGYINQRELEEALREQTYRSGEALAEDDGITAPKVKRPQNSRDRASNKVGFTFRKLGEATVKQTQRASAKTNRKIGEIVRDNGLITGYELSRALVMQRYESACHVEVHPDI